MIDETGLYLKMKLEVEASEEAIMMKSRSVNGHRDGQI